MASEQGFVSGELDDIAGSNSAGSLEAQIVQDINKTMHLVRWPGSIHGV